MEFNVDHLMAQVVTGFELAGVMVLAIGSLWALVVSGRTWQRGERSAAYGELRRGVGRAVLLGLEVLIIADIVQTITIDPTLESSVALGLIVLVRTFLSFSLEIELEGMAPWNRWRIVGRPPTPTVDEPGFPAGEDA